LRATLDRINAIEGRALIILRSVDARTHGPSPFRSRGTAHQFRRVGLLAEPSVVILGSEYDRRSVMQLAVHAVLAAAGTASGNALLHAEGIAKGLDRHENKMRTCRPIQAAGLWEDGYGRPD